MRLFVFFSREKCKEMQIVEIAQGKAVKCGLWGLHGEKRYDTINSLLFYARSGQFMT